MKLKQLTLQGYKTFPTKTDFIFDEGITAIVGPNGSGKSNIADALRWVLGEQSYSTLRGKRTIDMIFSGSQTRSRSGMAQATLTLDNSGGWLPIDYSEVEISRRAYRSGENEYILNGQKVRLKDISELLSTSGLSERTYTIIGQGLIDQALSLRADERRALFEEAAGINHYKARRAETLRRLNETQHNLERVQDILAEIKPRMNSLKRQAMRAKNFEQINQDLRHQLRIWYGYKWDQARNELREAKKNATQAESSWKDSRRAILNQQQTIDNLQQQITQGQQRISELMVRRDKIREMLEQARRESAINEERKLAIRKQLTEIANELPAFEGQQRNAEEQLLAATRDLESAQEQLANNRKLLEKFNLSFQEQQTEINFWQSEAAQAEKNYSLLQNNLAQGQGQISQLKERLRERELEKDDKSAEELDKLILEGDRQAELLERAIEEVKEIRRKRHELQSQRSQLIKELKKLRDQANGKQNELNRHRDHLARLETKSELMDQLRHKEINIGEDVNLIGSLASKLSIPEEYKTAIESALSDRLATLMVYDSPSLWELVNKAVSQKLVVIALEDFNSPKLEPLPQEAGVIAWASEVVSTSDDFRELVRLLLGPILLVDTRNHAYQVARTLPPGTMAVANDGFITHAGGLVQFSEGFSKEGYLLREEAWQETQARLNESRQELSKMDSVFIQLQGEIQQQQGQVDSLQNEDRELSRSENELVQKHSLIQRRVDHNKQQRAYLERQNDHLEREINSLSEKIRDFESRITADEAFAEKEKIALAEAQAQLAALPVAEAEQRYNNLEQGISSAETIVAGRLAVVDSRKTTLTQIENQISRLKIRNQNYLAQLEELEGSDIEKEQKSLNQRQMELDQEIEPFRQQLISLRETLFDLQSRTAETQKRAHEIETTYTQTQVKLTQKENQIESLRERIHADLGLVALRLDEDQSGPIPLPITNIFDQLPSVDELPSDIEQSIQEYRGQLQRIGGINPDAPAEYEETQERFEFMTQQVEDLNATEEQLRRVISELDELTSKAFADTVEHVNGIFGDTFTQLFGGGSARLVLTDPDDLTISGVDIIARLPNRREQGLGLLSGGERSLTASALIFSLLKVSPTPFCVLDEVDAALDEANITRFRDILRELSLKTQIICITHNRGTVQAAQTIYGVSMQPDSASQVISIRPEEYVRRAAA